MGKYDGFYPSVGKKYDHPLVYRLICMDSYGRKLTSAERKLIRQVEAMRIWSVTFNNGCYLQESDPNGGYYSRAACQKRCDKLNKLNAVPNDGYRSSIDSGWSGQEGAR